MTTSDARGEWGIPATQYRAMLEIALRDAEACHARTGWPEALADIKAIELELLEMDDAAYCSDLLDN